MTANTTIDAVFARVVAAAMRFARFGLVLTIAVMGCGSPVEHDPEADAGPPTPTKELGSSCMRDVQCIEGTCEPISGTDRVCTRPCESAADCGDALCAVRADGQRTCLLDCSHEGFACVDGVPTACERVAAGTHCEECTPCSEGFRCADDVCVALVVEGGACGLAEDCAAGLRCLQGVCAPPVAVGAPCEANADCASLNCSPHYGVCRVGVGEPCDASNCDTCFAHDDGWSFCSRNCVGSPDDCNGAACIGSRDVAWCRPRCAGPSDASCPIACSETIEGTLYCDCGWGGLNECDALSPRFGLYTPCTVHSSCIENACLSNYDHGGYCTRYCAADADCGDGACADLHCVGDETCGRRCVARCAVDADCPGDTWCRDLPSASGGTVTGCDARLPAGHPCNRNPSCLSGECVSGTCR